MLSFRLILKIIYEGTMYGGTLNFKLDSSSYKLIVNLTLDKLLKLKLRFCIFKI